jgi:hypothetical protein
VRLGRCLNLLGIEHSQEPARVYEGMVAVVGAERMPRNTERGANFLDREIIEAHCRAVEVRTDSPSQTVRWSFAEGDPIYPGSKILVKAHMQIAVRDPSCILNASLVRFP